MDDPIHVITLLLRDQHGIAESKLRPTARLGHDLGVDGSDVSDLLSQLHERFGTDFSALDGQWTEFFGNEGVSLRSIVVTFLLLVSSTAVTVAIAAALRLSPSLAGALGVITFFTGWLAIGWLFPGKAKRPVTILGLAEVVQAGAWPTDPNSVR
jgi:hypothetical protein